LPADFSPEISIPKIENHGDFSTNAAILISKILQKNPREIATEILNALTPEISRGLIEKIEIAGAGFLNFFLTDDFVAENLQNFDAEKLTLSSRKISEGNLSGISGTNSDLKNRDSGSESEFCHPELDSGSSAIAQRKFKNEKLPEIPDRVRNDKSEVRNDKVRVRNGKNKFIGRKICVDFSHPNIAKPLHFGHFRSTIIGESLVRILRAVGAEVLADNYLGDWGTQFGKLVFALKKFEPKFDEKNPEKFLKNLKNPTEFLVKLYQKFHAEAEKNPELEKAGAEEFRKMEVDRDENNLKIWREIVAISLAELKIFYEKVDANFDEIRGESFWEKFVPEILEKMRAAKILQKDAGAEVVFFDEKTKLPPMLFLRSDGATFYQTRDIARIDFYERENFDELIFVVGADQNLHFRQLAETARLMKFKTKISHAQFGMVVLPTGKMSTRRGTAISLDEVLRKAENLAAEILTEKSNLSSRKISEGNLSGISGTNSISKKN
jgi:arginyl-tRNA synthetase